MTQQNQAKQLRGEILKEIATIELGIGMLELADEHGVRQDEKGREAKKQIVQKLEESKNKLQAYLDELETTY